MNSSAELKNVTGSKSESTEIGLFVRTSGQELAKWDKQAIYDALMRETDISPDAASGRYRHSMMARSGDATNSSKPSTVIVSTPSRPSPRNEVV